MSLLAELAQHRGVADPTDVDTWLRRQRVAGQPERWLALKALLVALDDAWSTPSGPRDARRDAARAWLLDDVTGYSARLCCDALDIDFDAMRERVQATWRTERRRSGT